MDECVKQELIQKLVGNRENINLLLNLLKREQYNVEQEIRVATEAKRQIDEILFELTGDKFYRNT